MLDSTIINQSVKNFLQALLGVLRNRAIKL